MKPLSFIYKDIHRDYVYKIQIFKGNWQGILHYIVLVDCIINGTIHRSYDRTLEDISKLSSNQISEEVKKVIFKYINNLVFS